MERTDADGHQPARFLDSQSTTLAATTTCANCGRRFTGNYCPKCGQKADAELAVWDIVGGFFRDLFDAENGLWPTLKGLTIAPGRTLRHYLSGARRRYMNPGRYLLVAALFQGLVIQLERHLGMREAGSDSGTSSAEGAVEAALGFLAEFETQSPGYFGIALSCLFAGLLSLLYQQLFASKTQNRASAVAIAVFLAAHGLILSTTIEACWRFPSFAITGTPAAVPTVLSIGALPGYAGIATYRCFESRWIDGLMATLAVGWAFVESISVIFLIGIGYSVILFLVDPVSYPLSGPGIAVAVIVSVLAALPFLLHAGVAAYARSR